MSEHEVDLREWIADVLEGEAERAIAEFEVVADRLDCVPLLP